MRCLYFQRSFYVFLCSSAKMAFVGFGGLSNVCRPARRIATRIRPRGSDRRRAVRTQRPAASTSCRISRSACAGTAAADGDAAAHGRAGAEPSDVGFAAAHAAPFVRHEGDEGLAREVVRCEEGRDGRCDGRPPAGRTDVDHVVSPGVGPGRFSAPDGSPRRSRAWPDRRRRGTPRGRASAGRFRRDRHPWPQRSVRPRRACCRCGKSRPPALFYRSAPFGRRRSRRQRRGW